MGESNFEQAIINEAYREALKEFLSKYFSNYITERTKSVEHLHQGWAQLREARDAALALGVQKGQEKD